MTNPVRPFTLLLLLVVSCCSPLRAQFVHEWTETEGGPQFTEFGFDVAVDEDGYLYMTGEYLDGAEIGGTTYPSAGFNDMFLSKYDPAGRPIWVQTIGSALLDRSVGVEIGRDGNIYVVGSGKATFPSRGGGLHNRDSHVMCFSPSGTLLWGHALDGDVLSEAYDVDADAAGFPVVAGFMETESYFPNDTLPGHGGRDAYLIRFDTTGEYVWGLAIGGTDKDEAYAAAMDESGNTYIGGLFTDKAFAGSDSVVSISGEDGFIAKADANGNPLWITSLGSPGFARVTALEVSADGDCYFTGTYTDSLVLSTGNLVSSDFFDIFYGKIDPSGNLVWVRSAGGLNRDTPEDLEVDANENIYLTGWFFGTIDFDTASATSSGFEDLFFCQADSNGNVLNFRSAHYSNSRSAHGIAVDKARNVAIAGSFVEFIDFSGDTIHAVNNTTDIFLAKFSSEPFSLQIASVTGTPFCGLDEFWVHFQMLGYPDTSNVLYLELSDSSGNFGNPDTIGILQTQLACRIKGTVPVSITGGSSYRVRIRSSAPGFLSGDNGTDIFLDPSTALPVQIMGDTVVCGGQPTVLEIDTGFTSQIWSTGDTSFFIVVLNPGTYWVEATDANGCSNRDEVQVVSCMSSGEGLEALDIRVFPNPSEGRFQLEMRVSAPGNYLLQVLDLHGRPVYRSDLRADAGLQRRSIELGALPKGVYLLQVSDGDSSFHQRLLLR